MQGPLSPEDERSSSGGSNVTNRTWLALLPGSVLALLIVVTLGSTPQRGISEVHALERGDVIESEVQLESTDKSTTQDPATMVLALQTSRGSDASPEAASPSENREILETEIPPVAAQPASDVPAGEVTLLASSAPGPSVEFGLSTPTYDFKEDTQGISLPEISATPGVTFVETMIGLLDHELNGRFWGWRPNDILIGRFTDNVNNYQLGVLEALRFTTLRLKDSLTRMGDADSYDPDLEHALNLLMNKATRFWFPSAESSYSEALKHLGKFLKKLENGERSFYYRKDTLLTLIGAYKDLLGNVNKTLVVSPVSWFKTDDQFYYAKGVAHVYFEILKVVRVGFKNQLETTLYGIEMMDHILRELQRVEDMNPWLILDSDLDGMFANHRANLNAPLSEVLHLLGVMSQL